jgi:sugar phosphate isomerase/epimerase
MPGAIKLSLATQTPEVAAAVPVSLLAGSFAQKLARAAQLGADGVELMPVDPTALDVAELTTGLAQAGLEVAAVGTGALAFAAGLTLLHAQPERAVEARVRFHQLIDLAAALGAPFVTVGSFRGRVAAVRADGRDHLAAVLSEAAVYAERVGVRLVLEPLNRYEADLIHTVDEALGYLEEIGQPALGLVVDTYHVNIEERSWTAPFRQAMAAGKLWHVHLGDNNRLPPGQGLIDFPAIVAALRDVGYTGYLSAELLARPDPDTAARQTLTTMRSLLED